MQDLVYMGAVQLAKAIRDREVSATEVVETHLARIAERNPALNAVVTLDADGAMARAREADSALARGEVWGPLHGVPMTLKDGHATAGMRTTAGFPPLAEYIPESDGTTAARMKQAGAIIMGKTNVPVMLMDYQSENPIFGRTNNPWNLGRTPGGSSGGAAAALADGMTPLEIGSDLGGSIRVPAHFCGLFGFKPTEHRVPLTGHIPDAPGSPRSVRVMGTIGPLARNMEDLTLAMGLLANPDGQDTDVPPLPFAEHKKVHLKGLRVAWAPGAPGMPVAAEIRAALESLANQLAAEGAIVEQTLPSIDFKAQGKLFNQLLRITDTFAPPNPEKPALTLAEYLEALHKRDAFMATWDGFFSQWDALLYPVTSTTAFPHCPTGTPLDVDGSPLSYYLAFDPCTTFSLNGNPSVVLPVAQDRTGLPIGVQLVGRRWQDERLLAIAGAVAELTGPCRRPPGY